jgi:hypothetical protein
MYSGLGWSFQEGRHAGTYNRYAEVRHAPTGEIRVIHVFRVIRVRIFPKSSVKDQKCEILFDSPPVLLYAMGIRKTPHFLNFLRV